MRRLLATTIVAGLALVACGDDDGGDGSEAKDRLFEELTADGAGIFDEDCLRDNVDDLSDEDARFLLDNADTEVEDPSEIEGISESAIEFIGAIFECVDFSDLDTGALEE